MVLVNWKPSVFSPAPTRESPQREIAFWGVRCVVNTINWTLAQRAAKFSLNQKGLIKTGLIA